MFLLFYFHTEFSSDEINIDNFQNTEWIENKKRYKPFLVAAAGCFPEGDAFPDERPYNKNANKHEAACGHTLASG